MFSLTKIIVRGLSPNEERYVLAENHGTASVFFTHTYHIRGKLDIRRLKRSMTKVIRSHETLMTRFRRDSERGYHAFLSTRDNFKLSIVKTDLEREDELKSQIQQYFLQPINLEIDCTTRALLVRVTDTHNILTIGHHHAAADGISHSLFINDLMAIYNGDTNRLPDISSSFSGCFDTEWDRSDEYKISENYWNDEIKRISPTQGLSRDLLGNSKQKYPDKVQYIFSVDDSAGLRNLAEAIKVSPFAVAYACFNIVLSKQIGANNVTSTFQSHGRRNFRGSDTIIGSFSNAVLIDSVIERQISFKNYVKELREKIITALSNEIVPYHRVIRGTSIHSRFGINWYPKLTPLSLNGCDESYPEFMFQDTDYEVNFRFSAGEDDRIGLDIFYDQNQFSRERIELVSEQFKQVLLFVYKNSDAQISCLKNLPDHLSNILPDPHKLICADAPINIVELFIQRALETPHAIAIEFKNKTFSYLQLNNAANNVACLIQQQDYDEPRVAIVADRTPFAFVTVLACLKLHLPFSLIDESYPENRKSDLIKILRPGLIIHESVTNFVNPTHVSAVNVSVDFEFALAEVVAEQFNRRDDLSPEVVAYYLFTSGTTGFPKCIPVSHGPLVNFLRWQKKTFALTATDHVSCLSGLSHDPIFRDLFLAMMSGSSIKMPEQEVIKRPDSLLQWFEDSGARVIHLTPQLGQLLTYNKSQKVVESVKYMFFGGDKLNIELIVKLRKIFPNTEFINLYGASETPQGISFYRLTDRRDNYEIPIGRGIDGCQLLVVDSDDRICARGEIGQIVVRSPYLANKPVSYEPSVPIADKASKKSINGVDAYYTGDYGCFLPSGEVQYLYRLDDTVNIRGYRVNLNEINRNLLNTGYVKQAVTIAVDKQTEKILASFIVGDKTIAGDQVIRSLEQSLPGYMVPERVVVLEKLPLLANGKIDREYLRHLLTNSASNALAPRDFTPSQQKIADCFVNVLSRPIVSPEDSFRSLHGDSLSYVQAEMMLEDVLGAVPDGWEHMSIAELAKTNAEPRRFVSVIESSVLIRCISIILIVLGHYKLLGFKFSATSALFLVAGFLAAKFQIPTILSENKTKTAFLSLIKLMIPVMIFSCSMVFMQALQGKEWQLSSIIPYENFFDASEQIKHGHLIWLWFIHVYLQIFVFLYLLLTVGWFYSLAKSNEFRAFIQLFIFSMVICIAILLISFHGGTVPFGSFFKSLPTTHLVTVVLGIVISFSDRVGQKVISSLAGVMWGLVCTYFFSLDVSLALMIVPLVLLWFPKVFVPRVIKKPIYTIASASLIIYLVHIPVHSTVLKLGITSELDAALISFVISLFIWAAWEKSWRYFSRPFFGSQQLDVFVPTEH